MRLRGVQEAVSALHEPQQRLPRGLSVMARCDKAGECSCKCYACQMRIHCKHHSEGCHENCNGEVVPIRRGKVALGTWHYELCLVARYAQVAESGEFPFPWCTCPSGSGGPVRLMYKGLVSRCEHQFRMLPVTDGLIDYRCSRCTGKVSMGWPSPASGMSGKSLEEIAGYHMNILAEIFDVACEFIGLTPEPTEDEIRERLSEVGVTIPEVTDAKAS